jgi:hypothetical protein
LETLMETVASDPMLDPSHIEGLYAALGAMHVELDADPLELGPKRLNAKIAECRGMLSRCERIFLDVSQSLHRYKRQHRAASADFKLRMRELITNDPEVRMGRNVTDREAIAANRLRPEAEEIDRLTANVEDLEAVLTVVRTKRADLKDIQGRLKDQLKVCQEEISLGGRWGKSLIPTGRIHDPAGDSVTELIENVLSRPTAKTPVGDEDIPVNPPAEDIPVVRHPDEGMFTDEGIDDILSAL